MTSQPSNLESERHTIQLLVHGESDQDALETFLNRRYDVTNADTLQPVDCYLIGEQMIPAYRDALREQKRTAHPTFTPVLLIQQDGSRGTVPPPSEQNDNEPPLIDEVVSAPVNQQTLFRRLENVLARREQSVELSDRYENIQTRFQRLFDSTNDALLVVAPSGDEITECNPAACDLLKYTREELLSASPTDVIHADDHGQFQSFLQKVQDAGEGSTDDLTCQTKNEEKRRLEVSAATLEGSKRSPIIFSVRDITERKAYERELELKSQAMDEAPVGITISDANQDDNPMVYVNEGFEALTGYSKSEAIGRNCRFLQGEATRDEPVAEMRKAIDEAEPVSVELRNYHKNGSQFWNRVSIAPVRDDTGTVMSYVGFQEDVSDRKKREEELQLFKRAVENTGHAVSITDKTGIIKYVNSVFEEQTGYTSAEAVGRTHSILNSSKQDDEFYRRMWQTILSGDLFEADLINRRKNGELYHVEQTVSPITNGDGEITHFVAIELDVTTQRLRRQQLEVLNRVLRHNLRNGMNIIKGNATILRDEINDDELTTQAKVIEERATALSNLSDQAGTVRSLFNHQSTAGGTCNVPQLVADVADEISDTYPEATLTIETNDSIYARGGSSIKTALLEILENAIIHNDQPTPEITIMISQSTEDRTGEWVEIVIADNGPGIPENEQETIASGEETPLQHGTGLGLWIVYWTVLLLGGEVTFEDNSPRGTRVVLNLPAPSNPKRATGLVS